MTFVIIKSMTFVRSIFLE